MIFSSGFPALAWPFAHGTRSMAKPVAARFVDGRYLVGVDSNARQRPVPGEEVILLVDEGAYFFDLRAIYVRGRVQPVERPEGLPDRLRWFEVEPTRKAAWDYGRLREADDDA